MRISYSLSKRQLRDLDRGQTLRLAIPLDADYLKGENEVEWVRSRLTQLRGSELNCRGERDVVIELVANPVGSGLSTRLGTLTLPEQDRVGWVIPVFEVHVVPQRPSPAKTRLQWPGGDISVSS